MKKITFNNIEYYYKVKSDSYSGTTTEIYECKDNFIKKFNFLGKRFGKMVNRPLRMFTLWYNIEHPGIEKERISKDFKSELDNYNTLRKRTEEIQRGEIL